MKIKRFIYYLLEPSEKEHRFEKILNLFLIALIILNVLAGIIYTVEWVKTGYYNFLNPFEIFSVGIFTIEYVLRMWTITCDKKYSKPIIGRIKYFFSFFALVDLFSILPFYLIMIFPFDLRFLRLFRLFRIVRVLKLGRYSESLQKFGRVFKNKKEDLFVSLMVVLFLVVLSSSIIYMVENEAQPDKYTNIPDSIYWSFITLTTVGYGDIYPITPLGKLFTIIIALLGLGMIALPTAIISSGFNEELTRHRKKFCPHCGKELP
ncbi:MAG: ion transporter [Bacteroidota bacterium]|nr:ion transporter [Bacteroidota bacterium]